MMTDPIADMLTRIRNAAAVHKAEVFIPYSRLKWQIAQLLAQEGFIETVEKGRSKLTQSEEIRVALKYREGKESVIHCLKRISKPGQRLYVGYKELGQYASGRGLTILSTPKGLMTNKTARQSKLGGEVICEVY